MLTINEIMKEMSGWTAKEISQLQEQLKKEITERDSYISTFPIERSNEKLIVSLVYIGEGYHGDYDDTDPEDEPLVRVDIYAVGDTILEYDNARDLNLLESRCTCIPATMSPELLNKGADRIFALFADADREEYSNLADLVSHFSQKKLVDDVTVSVSE